MADPVTIDASTPGVIPWFLKRVMETGQMPSPEGPETSPAPPAPPPDSPPSLTVAGSQPPAPPPPSEGQVISSAIQPQGQPPTLAPETKAHKLLQILLGGARGALMGAASNAQTYAQTGRNAGFGGGAYGAMTMPLELERSQLQNEQIKQMLPFLRATQMANLGKIGAETGKLGAEAQKAQAEVEGMPIKQALEQAQTESAYYKSDPNMGLIDIRTGQPVSPAGLAPLGPEQAAVLGKKPGDLVPLKLKNTADEIVQRGYTVVAGANDAYLLNKGTGQKTPLGVGSPRAIFAPQNRIVQVADPDKPGETKFTTAGQAMQTGAAGPQSASVQAPKAVAKKATSGTWADQKIAFNTAIQHAELLRDAAKALNNGDINALNALKNQAATQFGDPDLTDFEAIANAYNHEITSVISKGHITDNEVKAGDRTLPANANYKTIDKVLKSYQALAQSKMQQLQKQIDEGMKGNTGASAPQGNEIHYKIVNGQLVKE